MLGENHPAGYTTLSNIVDRTTLLGRDDPAYKCNELTNLAEVEYCNRPLLNFAGSSVGAAPVAVLALGYLVLR